MRKNMKKSPDKSSLKAIDTFSALWHNYNQQ